MIENIEIFIQSKGKVQLNIQNVISLKNILNIYSDDYNIKVEIENLVYNLKTIGNNNTYVINIISIIPIIKRKFPNSTINIVGEPDILVEFKSAEMKNNDNKHFRKICKVTIVCSLLFVGAATAIINFHSDVDMLQTQKTIYRIITGKETENLLLMQIPYSLGIGVGMSVFFNHIFKKKINNEPSPLEVEVQLYQESLDQYVKKTSNNYYK
ncbi:stage V sporulation protein AA [Natronincola peptidivorans]|uniref:Stage V sporulation protein AA n=1 Tax=Natronincola peptidivorans TaxID=426128 RepID=A0A1H9Z3C5_9FIRM|nr:stage V sporulation protein AA [Natronincola peptidivorans]SES76044.1 stage V sporulation protein AA [Natronincola peptidivorans]